MTIRPGSRIAIPVLAAVLFTVILLQIRSAPETYPWGDTATTSIYAIRAARGELATGAYSRFHWNHPGPLLYQLLAPLYRLTGYREISLKWTMWMLNVAALGSMLFVLWRRAPVLAVAVAAALIPLLSREQRLLFWAWNPIAPLMALALSIGLGAGVAAGEMALLPWLAAVTSFIVQSHVGLTPVVAVIVIAACGLRFRTLHRPGAPADRTSGRQIALTAIVLAALWAVPIANELRSRPGNLARLAGFFLDRSNEPQPISTAGAVLINQLVGPLDPAWALTTAGARDTTSAALALAVAAGMLLLVAATLRAARRGATYDASFGFLCIAGSLVALPAIRSIVGSISDYLVIWIAVIGALSLAMIAAEAVQLLHRRASPGRGWAKGLASYVVIVASVGAFWLIAKHAADARSVVVRSFAQNLARHQAAAGVDRPLLGFSPAAWEIGTGMILQFYKEGRPIAVAGDSLYLVGEPFRATGSETGEFYLMHEDEEAFAGRRNAARVVDDAGRDAAGAGLPGIVRGHKGYEGHKGQ